MKLIKAAMPPLPGKFPTKRGEKKFVEKPDIKKNAQALEDHVPILKDLFEELCRDLKANKKHDILIDIKDIRRDLGKVLILIERMEDYF